VGRLEHLLISRHDIHPKQIVLGNPNYPDQKEGKVRPLLIISSDTFHQNSGFFVCVGITTNKEPDPYLLPLQSNQIKSGLLKYGGQIMCKRIIALNQKIIREKIAEVADLTYHKVIEKIEKDILQL